jgi:predicted RNase H-related nuclease YkuK (DUF458 family)
MKKYLSKIKYESLFNIKKYYSKKFVDYSLYLITDSKIAKKRGKTIHQVVEESCKGGSTMIQLVLFFLN